MHKLLQALLFIIFIITDLYIFFLLLNMKNDVVIYLFGGNLFITITLIYFLINKNKNKKQ